MKCDLRKYIGTKQLYKEMALIAIPISLQQLITVGINLMDTMMLSNMGDAQLSAATLASQYILLFHICCMGVGMGASVLTSRFWGMKDKKSLKQTITIMLRFGFVLSSVFTIITLLFPRFIMQIYSNDEVIINYGISYIRWATPTFYCLCFSLTCSIVLRTVEEVKISLISSVLAFFINVFFNWVFIFGKLGAPRMEIAGAALGTLISRIFELLFICGYFFLVDKKIDYCFRNIFMNCRNLFREYIRLSLPVLISDSLLAFGNNALAMIMGHVGTTFVAANSVTNVVQQMSSVLIQGMFQASGIITGHTIGMGKYEKAQKDGYAFVGMGFLIGCLAALLITLFRVPVINFYQVSDEAKAIAGELMNAITIIVIFDSMNSILTKGVLRAGGDTKFLMAGDILFLWIASIPLGALAGLVFRWPAFWIYTMLRIDQIIKCFWCIRRLRSGKWIKKLLNK